MALGLSKTRLLPIAVDFGVDSIKLLQVNLTDPPQFVAAVAVDYPRLYARIWVGAANLLRKLSISSWPSSLLRAGTQFAPYQPSRRLFRTCNSVELAKKSRVSTTRWQGSCVND